MVIFAIESSCDETSVAVLENGSVKSNVIATQEIHARYGGVVPEMASRAHVEAIILVAAAALEQASIDRSKIDVVAFTQAPGLIGSLMVGASFAKAMAQALGKPLVAVNHMRAHVLAHFIDDPKPGFPFLCLTVSGGHTQLVLMRSYLDLEVIGTTLDDAAGEAFDKTAKMLGLPYPGGPLVDKYAKLGEARFKFPVADIPGLDFSFSGIKTSVLYFLQKERQKDADFVQKNINDICASVQHTIIRALSIKFEAAILQTGVKSIGIAGGVSANSGLRAAVAQLGDSLGVQVFIPKFEYCTDNAAMIGIAAHYQALAGDFADLSTVPSARATF